MGSHSVTCHPAEVAFPPLCVYTAVLSTDRSELRRHSPGGRRRHQTVHDLQVVRIDVGHQTDPEQLGERMRNHSTDHDGPDAPQRSVLLHVSCQYSIFFSYRIGFFS